MSTNNGQYAKVNGINFYYEIHGTGRPMVALHGGLGSGEITHYKIVYSPLFAETALAFLDKDRS